MSSRSGGSALVACPRESDTEPKNRGHSRLGTAQSSPPRGRRVRSWGAAQGGAAVQSRALSVRARMVTMSDRVSVSSGENVVVVVPVSMPSP